MDSALDGCFFNIGIRQCPTGLRLILERFVEINHHHHAGFYRDSKKRNVADCHGDAEVVVKKSLQEQPSGAEEVYRFAINSYCIPIQDTCLS